MSSLTYNGIRGVISMKIFFVSIFTDYTTSALFDKRSRLPLLL